MIIDALVLAGGRGSRLGSVSKASLHYGGQTLLQHTLQAVDLARHTVVVGDPDLIEQAAPGVDVILARESPSFAGPASAIGAGVRMLESVDARVSDQILVLACDMPRIALAIPVLLQADAAAEALGHHGVIAVSETGRDQLLVGLYSREALRAAIADHDKAGDLENLSVHVLVAGLDLLRVPVPAGATADVDTWDDARLLGISGLPAEETAAEDAAAGATGVEEQR